MGGMQGQGERRGPIRSATLQMAPARAPPTRPPVGERMRPEGDPQGLQTLYDFAAWGPNNEPRAARSIKTYARAYACARCRVRDPMKGGRAGGGGVLLPERAAAHDRHPTRPTKKGAPRRDPQAIKKP